MALTVQNFSRMMTYVTIAIIIAFPVLSILTWSDLNLFKILIDQDLGEEFNLSAVGTPGKIAGFLVSICGAGIHLFGFLALLKTFQEAAQGRPLSLKAIVNFRRFAFVTVAMVFIGILQNTAYIVIFSIYDPEKPRQLAITIGSNELYALFVGILFLFAASIFASGRIAQEENAAFL